MQPDLTQQRHHAHAFLDQSMLSPLDRKLALAPIDDEPLTPEDAAAIRTAIASLEKNGGVPMEDVLADYGLTMDDFHKMAGTSQLEESSW